MYYVDDIKINVRIATEFKLRLVVSRDSHTHDSCSKVREFNVVC